MADRSLVSTIGAFLSQAVQRKAATIITWPTGNLIPALMPRTRFDYEASVRPMDNSIVTGCVNWFARNFPEAPMLVSRLTGEEREWLPEHEVSELLDQPNPFYDGTKLLMGLLVDYLTTGNAYVLKVRGKNDTRTVQLWFMPSALVTPESPTDGSQYLTGYKYAPGSEARIYAVEDVIHLRFGIDPRDTRKGWSPIRAALREIFTDDEAANYTASLLRNMGVPGFMISPKEGQASYNKDQADNLKKMWLQNVGGDRRGEPLVFAQAVSVDRLGMNPAELNLRDLRRIPEERVSADLGIPAIVAGLGAGLDRSTFANMKEAREMAFENGILPVQRLVAADFTAQLLRDFTEDRSFRIGFDTRLVRVLQEDEDSRAERATTLLTGSVATRAEARALVGLPVETGDDVYLQGFAIVERPQGEVAPADTGSTETASLDRHSPRAIGEVKARSLPRRDAAFVRAQAADEERLIAPFTRALNKVFDDLADAVADAFTRAIAPNLVAVASTNGGAEFKQEPGELFGEDDVLAIVERTMATANATSVGREALERAFEQHWSVVGEATFGNVKSVYGLDIAFSAEDPVGRAIISRGGTRAGLVDIERQAKDSIFRALTTGREAGDGPPALARRIRSSVKVGRFTGIEASRGAEAAKVFRSNLIARTETKFAQNQSVIEGARASGAVTEVRAVDAQLGETDDECENRNGQVFSLADAELEQAQEHPNGTLSWTPVIRAA